MSVMPLFSVIIPTCQRNDLLAKCLDRLVPEVQTLPAEQYEVIVSDDGSQNTAEHLVREQYRWVKWVAGPRKGPAANRNNGARHAQGEWLVFIDDDCIPDQQWLESFAAAITDDSSQFVLEGRTYVDRERQSLGETSPINETGGYLWSCNFAIKRSLFFSLKGFDVRFSYAAMEDVDLRLRLIDAGQNFSFVTAAAVCHPWRPKGGWKKLKQHQAATLTYLSIHPQETATINSVYYLQWVFRDFIKITLPGIVKFKGKGTAAAMLEHFSFLQMAFLLMIKPNSRNDHAREMENEKIKMTKII